mgnify:CR=1 FL=1
MSPKPHIIPANDWPAIPELAPIAPLLADDTVNDVLINGFREVYVERAGKLEKTSIVFPSEEAVQKLAMQIVKAVGRELSAERPLIDARLSDGSRVNVIAPPLAVAGRLGTTPARRSLTWLRAQ